MITVGIVGLGKMGILHARILNALPDCQAIAVCKKESMLTKIAKKVLPKISFYDNVTEMVEKHDLKAVYVTASIASRAPIVDDLAGTRKSFGIFMKKRLAGNSQDAKRIVERSASIGKMNMIGFQKRFLPQFQRVKSLIDQGALGNMLFFKGYSLVSSVFSQGHGWRFERGQGGSLLDLGAHLIDLVVWYFGEPKAVSCRERL